MELWQSPDYQDTKREYAQMNQELMEEVTLSVPAVTEPILASVTSHVSVPEFSAPIPVNVPHSRGNAVDTDLWETWEQGQALRKPYPGAPIVTSGGESVGFNSG